MAYVRRPSESPTSANLDAWLKWGEFGLIFLVLVCAMLAAYKEWLPSNSDLGHVLQGVAIAAGGALAGHHIKHGLQR